MSRILFVDDDPGLLDGLQDLLRKQRHHWQMTFTLGAAAALAELERAPADVVVSDMRMPGRDGTSLLREIRDRHPETTRIVLSGQTDLDSALRTVPVAHRFLAKPCQAGELVAAIDDALALRPLLANPTIRRAAGGLDSLPSPPVSYQKLIRLLDDPEVPLEAVAAVIERDLAMSAKVLQLVNSAFFGLGRRITTIAAATSYLGIATLRALAVSSEAFRAFQVQQPVTGFSLDALEQHSLAVARLAARIAPTASSDDAFTAGLLHDLGKLVLASERPDEASAIARRAAADAVPQHSVETARNGYTHADVGGYLLALWGLPREIVAAVADHHTPGRLGAETPALTAVHVADALLHERTSGDRRLDESYCHAIGIADHLPTLRTLLAPEAPDD